MSGQASILRATGRRPGWTSSTIAAIALMIALVIAGFAYIGGQQRELSAIRETTREMRMTRQALMEADAAVLNAIVHPGDRAGLLAYDRALEKLNGRPAESFPATSVVGGSAVPAATLVASLKSDWSGMIAETSASRTDRAAALYVSSQTRTRMRGLIQTFVGRLERLDQDYTALQRHVDVAIVAVMILQIATGLTCILAFTVAALRGAREAQARARAMSAATASREQVLRLFQMTDMLQSASDQADANAILTSTAADLIAGYGGALYVFNNSRDRLILSTSWNVPTEELADSIGLHQCWALKRGKTHVNQSEARGLSCDHHAGDAAVLEIPMAARGEVLGLFQIHAAGADAASRLDEVRELGAAMADAMSLALANIALRDRLRSQALRDPLTGLYNRRYMEDALERVVRLADREQQEVAVIMIDLDHFKRLNDQYGHAKGDAVLRDAAAAVIAQLRESDVACRYGGEELLVVMPNCGLDDALAKAERIRSSIESLSESGGAKVSASLGVSAFPATAGSIKDLLVTSDAALYGAKEGGRNQVAAAPRQTAPATRSRSRRASRPPRPELVAAE